MTSSRAPFARSETETSSSNSKESCGSQVEGGQTGLAGRALKLDSYTCLRTGDVWLTGAATPLWTAGARQSPFEEVHRFTRRLNKTADFRTS